MRKCGFCTQRTDAGREPACVAKCPSGALSYYPDGKIPVDLTPYGKAERFHMVYALQGQPGEYGLPDPVPTNIVTGGQVWKWLGGLVPGAFVLAWVWKKAVSEEETHE